VERRGAIRITNMDVLAKMRHVRISPSKARDLARTIQGKSVADALRIVEFSERKGALLIAKTLKSAIANAENNAKLNADQLVVREAVIESGPMMKRGRPRSRGMSHPILKRTSHIKITLTDSKPAGK
jgi:large subunit ribosomal protein L22